MPFEFTVLNNECINLLGFILALKEQNKIDQIICGCDSGSTKSQSMYVILTRLLADLGLKIPVEVISFDGVPATGTSGIYLTKNDIYNERSVMFKEHYSINKVELLSNKFLEEYIPDRKNSFLPENPVNYAHVQNEWSRYAGKYPRNLFIFLESFVCPHVQLQEHFEFRNLKKQYLLDIFPESTFISANVNDYIKSPNFSGGPFYPLNCYEQMDKVLKYRFKLVNIPEIKKINEGLEVLKEIHKLSNDLTTEMIIQIYGDYHWLCFFEQYSDIDKNYLVSQNMKYVQNVTCKHIVSMFLHKN